MSAGSSFLSRIVDPASTAVLTMELQNGVVGPQALMKALGEEVERTHVLATVKRICAHARDAGIRVVHCTYETRPDGAGTAVNCRIFAASERIRQETGHTATEAGSAGAALVDGLLDPRDIVVPRLTGMTPFTSTSLDQLLRNLGVKTVVATGVSVNLGIFGMAMTALDLGYQVVVVRDAVAGVPYEYAQAVIDQSLSLIATVTTADELIATMAAREEAT